MGCAALLLRHYIMNTTLCASSLMGTNTTCKPGKENVQRVVGHVLFFDVQACTVCRYLKLNADLLCSYGGKYSPLPHTPIRHQSPGATPPPPHHSCHHLSPQQQLQP